MQNYNDYEQLDDSKLAKKLMMASSLTFVGVLIIGGVLFWLAPKQQVSLEENRNLAVLPIANRETVFSGEFEKSFENYYNDHFVLRDTWINFADHIKAWRGVQSSEFKVIIPTTNRPDTSNQANLTEQIVTPQKATFKANLALNQPLLTHAKADQKPVSQANLALEKSSLDNGLGNTNDKAMDTAISDEVAVAENFDDDFSRIKGVVITKGRVVQIFAGSKATISPFATMLNDYKKRLGAATKVYAMIIPAGSDFYLPYEVNKGVLKERENIAVFNELLDGVVSVDAYNALAPHTKEYIMFGTDHHWTGLGAYYAYTAFVKQAGFVPLTLAQMTYVETHNEFLGSLYNYTHDNSLKNHKDTLEYYKIPGDYEVKIFDKNGNNPKAGRLYYEQTNGYGVFLGGDFPLMHIHNDSVPTRKILVVKDSFGNALSTYLPYHYSDVYVVDYRHFKGNLIKLMQDNAIKELLYAHNSFAANSKAAVNYGNGLKHP